jgi:tetraacyldisaccharide 4'-kinase
MSSTSSKKKFWQYLLLPFSWLYGGIIYLRHFLFDSGLWPAQSFPLPVICVGNLSTGGTGKTPTVLYLLNLLKDKKVATLSRGYKRKTKGFLIAGASASAQQIGDEPYLFYQKFPGAIISVGEDRKSAIQTLLKHRPSPEVILLDDGYQHRQVKPGFSILLTDYNDLFTEDFFLPAGHLRDSRTAAKRAQVILVTKCPRQLSLTDKEKITRELIKYGPKIVFFSYISYQAPYSLKDGKQANLDQDNHILLIHGIARAKTLRAYTKELDPDFKEIAFADHHDYTLADIDLIKANFQKLPNGQKMILTTEKDSVKLEPFRQQLEDLPFYILPIELDILFRQKADFNQTVLQYINNHKK